MSASFIVRLMFKTIGPSRVRYSGSIGFRVALLFLAVCLLLYTLRIGSASSRGRLLNNTFLRLSIFIIISVAVILYLVIRIHLASNLSGVVYSVR